MSDPYDKNLQDIVRKLFTKYDIEVSKGIYIGITGPSLETSAERRFLAQCGGDAVGMSTVMEVIAAKQAGFQIIGLSAITNKADGGPSQRPDTIEDVLMNATTASRKILNILPGLIETKKQIYTPMGRYQEFDNMLMKLVRQIDSQNRSGVHAPDRFLALSTILDEMRLFKNEVELKSIKKAIEITTEAHIAAMKKAYAGVFEFELEAEIMAVFMRHGARYPAYPSIVGGGENACILHYTDNKDRVADGELVLIDAGAEYGCYLSLIHI